MSDRGIQKKSAAAGRLLLGRLFNLKKNGFEPQRNTPADRVELSANTAFYPEEGGRDEIRQLRKTWDLNLCTRSQKSLH